MDVMRQGAAVEVIAPAALRDEVRQQLEDGGAPVLEVAASAGGSEPLASARQ